MVSDLDFLPPGPNVIKLFCLLITDFCKKLKSLSWVSFSGLV
jgi:hypothetical protein